MNSLRRWLYRPKRTDSSLLAQFYYGDEELNMVASELDSFDGRKDPERCTALVNQLRVCQDKVLSIIQRIMDEAIESQRASRDFRVKFPDDVLQESLAGQLWFGAECLAAGSSIMNREIESASMRPLARALTKNLDSLRSILREQCLRNINSYTERIKEALIIFDKLFAEFELSYVSAMVPVKTMKEYDMLQEITVLFSETVQRALKTNLLSQDMIDDYDPALMFTIPRLAIVCGLFIYPEGPLNPDMDPASMSEMFRPFQTLLYKIRELLYTLSPDELIALERVLYSQDDRGPLSSPSRQVSIEQLGQTDAGFEDDQENVFYTNQISLLDNLEEPFILHTPNSGSPVTPVNDCEQSLSGMTQSPSNGTIVEENLSNQASPTTTVIFPGVEQDLIDRINASLNKSDSRDSGLHSENVSTSDGVTQEIAPSVATCDMLGCLEEPPIDYIPEEGEETPGACGADNDISDSMCSPDESCSKSCCRQESGSGPRYFCREIVDEMVSNSVDTANRDRYSQPSSNLQLARQYSWTYNLDFEIPRISVSDYILQNMENENFEIRVPFQREGAYLREETSGLTEMEVSDSVNSVLENNGPNERNTSKSAENLHVDTSHFGENEVGRVRSHSHSSIERQQKESRCSDIIESVEDRHNKKSKSRTSSGPFEKLRRKTGSSVAENDEIASECLDVPRIQRLRYSESISSSCSSCHDSVSSVDGECDWEKESYGSSETSSYNSECRDDEEIALAIQAAEYASRNEARSRFRSSSDLIHRLFVCISGVADQLQTNYAGDLRHILKSVFDMNCSEPLVMADNAKEVSASQPAQSVSPSTSARPRNHHHTGHNSTSQDPPTWIPDELALSCCSCKSPFTFVRRRHHCRNCGRIFCGRCSSNFVPLPEFGHLKPVRVCNRCFVFQVMPFTVNE